jgi:hypothetical protein
MKIYNFSAQNFFLCYLQFFSIFFLINKTKTDRMTLNWNRRNSYLDKIKGFKIDEMNNQCTICYICIKFY